MFVSMVEQLSRSGVKPYLSRYRMRKVHFVGM